MSNKHLSAEEYLKKKYKNEFHIFLRYFLEGYYIPTVKFDELVGIAKVFKERENEEMYLGLVRELKLLGKTQDWEHFRKFANRCVPYISFEHDRPKRLVEMLLLGLS